MKLEAKNGQLLRLLSREGRLTNRDLASRIGLSPGTCLARVKRLERAKVILGYHAVIASNGPGLEGLAEVRLIDADLKIAVRFEMLINETADIVQAHRIAGHYDYVLHFLSEDVATVWSAFLSLSRSAVSPSSFRNNRPASVFLAMA